VQLGITGVLLAQPSFSARSKESAQAIMKTTLAVVIKEKDEKTMRKLSKKLEDLKNYQESVDAMNEYLKAAVEKEWNISKEVKFITEAEAAELEKKESPGYLLIVTEKSNYKIGDFYTAYMSDYMRSRNSTNTAERSMAEHNMRLSQSYFNSNAGKTLALAIVPAEKQSREEVYSYLPAVGISPGAFTYMVCHLKNQVLDGAKGVTGMGDVKDEIEKRQGRLKSKTLLIYDPLISKGLRKTLDGNKIKEDYPYAIEEVSLDRVEEVIANKDSKYAYIWVVPAAAVSQGGAEVFNYFIIDAADSRPLFLTGSAAMGASGKFHQMQLRDAAKKLKK
jgi:hypothetical protein